MAKMKLAYKERRRKLPRKIERVVFSWKDALRRMSKNFRESKREFYQNCYAAQFSLKITSNVEKISIQNLYRRISRALG